MFVELGIRIQLVEWAEGSAVLSSVLMLMEIQMGQLKVVKISEIIEQTMWVLTFYLTIIHLEYLDIT